MDWLSKYDKVI
jgi:hypothetical protein